MKFKRLWWTIRLYLTPGNSRMTYIRKHRIFAEMGKKVGISDRKVPLYSELIRIHNNVRVARNVDFCTHDTMHHLFNHMPKEQKERIGDYKFKERIGCIEIMDNCFIGSNSVILYGVRIGPNVIIASDSLVNKDCEPNSVYAGCPARRIGSFDDFMEKRMKQEQSGEIATTTHNQALTPEEISRAWEIFERRHNT